MEIRIGVVHSAREIELDLGDKADEESVKKNIDAALAAESALWLTDRRGRSVGIPAGKITFVEIGTDTSERRVGFVK